MANQDYETHEHDVLVIGAGGAGLRAAIEAAAQGVSVGFSDLYVRLCSMGVFSDVRIL